MIGEEQPLLTLSHDDPGSVGMIPRALSHLFDTLRSMKVEFAMRVSYLELYNEELCDLLSTDDTVKIKIFDDVSKKGSVIVQGLEEIPVRGKDDVYKLLAKGQDRRKTAATLMNAQSSRSHTVFSILVHIKENGPDGEEMLKIGKLNLVDLAGSENISKAGNEKGIRTRESVNINQSLLTLGRVITALVERAPHIPYRESKLTRLLQESLGGRTKTSIIATVSCGHKDLEETLSTLDYAHRAKNIQNKPEINQRMTKKVILKEYTEEIDRLKRDLNAAREKNGVYLAHETYNDLVYKTELLQTELNDRLTQLKRLKDDFEVMDMEFKDCKVNFDAVSTQLVITEQRYQITDKELSKTKRNLKKVEQNYTEAKHVINVQQETEEKITKQAKEIIQVADEASKDTKYLQENIKRRKEKDERAEKVTNNLLTSITMRVNEIEQQLDELKKDHKKSSDLIVSDLEAHVISNKSFSSALVKCISELKDVRVSAKELLLNKIDKWMHESNSICSEEIEKFSTFIASAQEREETFLANINDKIDSFVKLLDERKAQENKLKDYCTEKINDQQRLIDEFYNYMQLKFETQQQQLNNISASLTTKNDAQVKKMEEVKRLMREIEDLNDQDVHIKKQVVDLREDIEGNCISRVKTLSDMVTTNVNGTKEFLTQSDASLSENHVQSIDDMKNAMQAIVENRGSLKRRFTDELESVKHVDKKFKVQNNLVKDIVINVTNDAHKEEELKNDELSQVIEKENKRAAIQIQEVTSVVQHNLHVIVKDMEVKISENCENISRDIDEYHDEDVFSYRPSGETPARKEYKFNRQLNTTSPHDRIIRRYRLEQGFNDSSLHDTSIIEVRYKKFYEMQMTLN
jgi:kinesin family protein 11